MAESGQDNNLSSKFAINLAEMMSDYGASVHEIEDAVFAMVKALKIEGHFVLFNKFLFTSFGKADAQRTTLTRFSDSTVNINKLDMIVKLCMKVISNKISVYEALDELDRIKSSGLIYGRFFQFLSWPLLSASFVFILLGSWKEVIASCFISIILFFVNSALSKNDAGTGLRLSIPVSAFIASVLATIINNCIFPITVSVTIISSLMRYMPGFLLLRP